MKKMISLITALSLTASLFMTAPIPASELSADSGYAESDTQITENKISDALRTKMQATSQNNEENKISVTIWYKDIDQTEVENIVEEETGLSLQGLQNNGMEMSQELFDEISDVATGGADALDSNITEQVSEYLAQTQNIREIERVQTEQYITERRSVAKEKYEEASEAILDTISLEAEQIEYESKYAPMIIADLTRSEIEALEADERVLELDCCEAAIAVEPTDQLSTIRDTSGITKIREDTGLDGTGVKVGIVENASLTIGGDVPASRCINLEPTSFENNSHVMNTVTILGSNYGIASGATVYCASNDGNVNDETRGTYKPYYMAIEALLDAGVSVINSSFGYRSGESTAYSQVEKWVDHVAAVHNVTFVASTGNHGNDTDNTRILSPALAYNVIAVGAYNNNNTSETADDCMYAYSSYNHVDGCFKPDIVAPANMLAGGTSSAAPYVSGLIALMIQLRPSLAAYPQAIKAILMASCDRKAALDDGTQEVMTQGLTNHQGAGIVDAYRAICIVEQGTYGVREIQEDDAYQEIQMMQPCYGATGMNVSIAWLRENYITASDHSGSSPTTVSMEDLDLKLYRKSTLLKSSLQTNSSTEMLYYTGLNNTNIEYTIEVYNETGTKSVRYGYAWSVNDNRIQKTKEFEGIYYLQNVNSGKYAQINTITAMLTQNAYANSALQKWVIQKNPQGTGYDIMSESSVAGYLSHGPYIDSTQLKAQVNSTRDVYLQLSSTDTGGIRIAKALNGKTQYLGVFDNLSVEGEYLAWSTFNQNSASQQWYLEKCAYHRGDANMDGIISTEDAELILSVVVKSAELTSAQTFLADVDANGSIEANDANQVLKIVVQLQ